MARVKDHEVFLWSRNPDENDFLIQRIASKVRAAEGDCRGRSGYSVQIRTLNLRHSKTWSSDSSVARYPTIHQQCPDPNAEQQVRAVHGCFMLFRSAMLLLSRQSPSRNSRPLILVWETETSGTEVAMGHGHQWVWWSTVSSCFPYFGDFARPSTLWKVPCTISLAISRQRSEILLVRIRGLEPKETRHVLFRVDSTCWICWFLAASYPEQNAHRVETCCGNVFCSVWDLILPQADVNQSRWMADMCLWAPWVYLGDASNQGALLVPLYHFHQFVFVLWAFQSNFGSCTKCMVRLYVVYFFGLNQEPFRCSAGACPANFMRVSVTAIKWVLHALLVSEHLRAEHIAPFAPSPRGHASWRPLFHAKDSCERICQRVRGWNLEGIRWYKHVRWTLATARDSGWSDYCERSESIGMYRQYRDV